jgi:hypothetical protein
MRWDLFGTAVLVVAVVFLHHRGGFAAFGRNRITDWLVFLAVAAALAALASS